MLTLQSRLRPNRQEVAAKVMDGEAIMINLSNGTYYSMDGVGGAIWEVIEGEHSLEEVVGAIVSQYDVEREVALADVESLVKQLVEENLVALSEDGPRSENQPRDVQQRLPYESPSLNIYRDMADLLALDPPMPGFQEPAWRDPE
jgi:hypothetical protein